MAKFQYHLGIVLILQYIFYCNASMVEEARQKNPSNSKPKLRLVSMVFRHGDRTMDIPIGETYPNDPFKDYDTYPMGYGQLINTGKKRAYQLGQTLRGRYNGFLGNIYYQPNINARSSGIIRCKMSLQLVLAGLYPPVNIQRWNSELAWQPMDMIYTSPHQDGLLFPVLCYKYREAYTNVLRSEEVKAKIRQFSDLMEELTIHTGKNITGILDLYLIYHVLNTQFYMGLPSPDWSRDMYPNGRLLEAALLQYHLLSYNDRLRKLNGGVLLNYIINDMINVINGTLTDRKINLFSAHELNVAAMLEALHIYDYDAPAFMSGVVIELLEKDRKYFVKVLYYVGTSPKIIEMSIPGCEKLCPYDKFVQLTSTTTATDEYPTCLRKIDENQIVRLSEIPL